MSKDIKEILENIPQDYTEWSKEIISLIFEIMEILKEISNDRLIIMVTHNPELAEKYSNRIVNLLDGEVTGDSNPYSEDEEIKDVEKTLLEREEAKKHDGLTDKQRAKRQKKKRLGNSLFFRVIRYEEHITQRIIGWE